MCPSVDMDRNRLKFLLLQIRSDHETQREELREFLECGRLSDAQIDCLDAFNVPDFQAQIINGYDGLFVGGSSDASVLLEHDFLPACYALIRHCYSENIPVFASCFGFQLAVVEFGGRVIEDKPNMEMGCLPIDIHPNAKEDPLCFDLPSTLYAICGHKERASLLPDNAIPLASTPACPHQFFKLKDKPFYASQFHPEVTVEDFYSRITRYQERYITDAALFRQILASVEGKDASLANNLIAHFIDRIVLA